MVTDRNKRRQLLFVHQTFLRAHRRRCLCNTEQLLQPPYVRRGPNGLAYLVRFLPLLAGFLRTPALVQKIAVFVITATQFVFPFESIVMLYAFQKVFFS